VNIPRDGFAPSNKASIGQIGWQLGGRERERIADLADNQPNTRPILSQQHKPILDRDKVALFCCCPTSMGQSNAKRRG